MTDSTPRTDPIDAAWAAAKKAIVQYGDERAAEERRAIEAQARTDALDVDALADDVRFGSATGTSDYWRGYNDGIDALVAAILAAKADR